MKSNKAGNNSTTTEAWEKLCTNLESLEFKKNFDVGLTEFTTIKFYLIKLSIDWLGVLVYAIQLHSWKQGSLSEVWGSVQLNSMYLLTKISSFSNWKYYLPILQKRCLIEEVNCTEPSPLLVFPDKLKTHPKQRLALVRSNFGLITRKEHINYNL